MWILKWISRVAARSHRSRGWLFNTLSWNGNSAPFGLQALIQWLKGKRTCQHQWQQSAPKKKGLQGQASDLLSLWNLFSSISSVMDQKYILRNYFGIIRIIVRLLGQYQSNPLSLHHRRTTSHLCFWLGRSGYLTTETRKWILGWGW